MTRVAVIGTGYVGTVTATCFAWLGHEVVGIDIDETRAGQLAAGQAPVYEAGLPELLDETLRTRRLTFTSELAAIVGAEVIFLCVGTPTGAGGAPDLSQVEDAVKSVADHMSQGTIIVKKFTVPVGSGNWVRTMVEDSLPRTGGAGFHVVSNPEFLREGSAIYDFLYPDRIVLGGENGAPKKVALLYQAIVDQSFAGGDSARTPELILTDLPSAEMVKYAANAFLATKISFANEIAAICELVGADARQVLPAIGADDRIGRRFLRQGLGWGGSCFGKDVAALITTAGEYGYNAPMLRATVDVNHLQRAAAIRKLQSELKVLKGRRIAVLGLAFKGGTDDLRDAPALEIISRLHNSGAVVTAYDPVVKDILNAPARLAAGADDAGDGADAVLIATEWPEFRELDPVQLRSCMTGRLVVDGRGVIDLKSATAAGLRVVGFGW